MFRFIRGWLNDMAFERLRRIAKERSVEKLLPQFWITFATTGKGNMVICHSCCVNHALIDAYFIADFPHGEVAAFGPYPPDRIDAKYVGRLLTEAEGRLIGGVSELEAYELQTGVRSGRPN